MHETVLLGASSGAAASPGWTWSTLTPARRSYAAGVSALVPQSCAGTRAGTPPHFRC